MATAGIAGMVEAKLAQPGRPKHGCLKYMAAATKSESNRTREAWQPGTFAFRFERLLPQAQGLLALPEEMAAVIEDVVNELIHVLQQRTSP